jgi:hypothetical protein
MCNNVLTIIWCSAYRGAIRLGEPNCELYVCSDLRPPPREPTAHKHYEKPQYKNISLIRLERPVVFTSTVQLRHDVCLFPLAVFTALTVRLRNAYLHVTAS